MRKSTLLGCALLVMLLGPLATLQAQTQFGVNVNVDCEDAELRSLIRSFFSRELRELGDVRVGERGTADFRVEAIALKQGRSDWMMSVIVSVVLQPEDLELPPDQQDTLRQYQKVLMHSLTTGDSSGDLGTEISQIASSFDIEVLKPIRKERKRK